MKTYARQAMKIRNLQAFEKKHPSSGNVRCLVVTGEVQVGGTIKLLQASERISDSNSPEILCVDVVTRPKRFGLPSTKWQKITFEKMVSPGDVSTVDFSLDGESVLQLDVGGGTQKWP
jgi:hypothetical protein